MRKPLLSLIVAVAENGVMGRDNGMPWHLPSDLQRFKKHTLGKPVIMGRKTYQSIGRPLPRRTNIVITRSHDFIPDSSAIIVVNSFARALDIAHNQARQDDVNEIFCIGGAEIFKLALSGANRLYITEILASIAGDTFFPMIVPDEWQAIMSEKPQQDKKDSHPTRFIIYERLKL